MKKNRGNKIDNAKKKETPKSVVGKIIDILFSLVRDKKKMLHLS